MADVLRTTEDVFKELDGISGVAAAVGVSYNCASNWKSFGRFPPATYLAFVKVFESRGLTADPRLWRMMLPQEAGK